MAITYNLWKIQQKLIPAITDRSPCSQDELALLALPTKLGRLGLADPTSIADQEHDASREITASMVQAIVSQETVFSQDPNTANPYINGIKKGRKSKRDKALRKRDRALQKAVSVFGDLM